MPAKPHLSDDPDIRMKVLLTKLALAVIALVLTGALAASGRGAVFVPFELLIIWLTYWYSDRIALFSMGATVVSNAEAPHLHATVEKLAFKAGIPKPRVAIADRSIPNAFATGRNAKMSIICVTRGLQRCLNEEEVEAVVAHEIGHIVNRDIAVMTLGSITGAIAGIWLQAEIFNPPRNPDGSRKSGKSEAAGIAAAVAIYTLTILLIMALSRYREFAADRVSGILTQTPRTLATALGKIHADMTQSAGRELLSAEPMNALLIAPALSPERKRSIGHLFSTHPPLEARVRKLLELEKQLAQSN